MVKSRLQHVVEVKYSESKTWTVLQRFAWRPEAENRAHQLRQDKKYTEVRVRTETGGLHDWSSRRPMYYLLEIRAVGSSQWRFLERALSQKELEARRLAWELQGTPNFFELRVRSVYRPWPGSQFLRGDRDE